MIPIPFLAVISGAALFQALIWIVIAAVIWWLLTWLISYIGIPEPFNKVCKVILAVAAVIFLINALLTLAGKPFIVF